MAHDDVPAGSADRSEAQGRRGSADGTRPGAQPDDRDGAPPPGASSAQPGGPSSARPDAPWPAEAAARVLSQERRSAHWSMRRGMVLPVGVWGVAWLVGFLAMWSGEVRGGNPWFRLAEPVAEGIFGGAIVVAGIVAVVVGIIGRQGMRGPSGQRDSLQGWAWSISMVAVGIVSLLLTSQAPGQRWMLVPALFALTVGALTMVTGALLRSVLQFVLGIFLVLLGVCGVWIGLPGMFLLYGLAGGAALLVFTVLIRLRPAREVRE